MSNETYTNHWKNFHDSFEDRIGKKYKEQIEKVLGCSQSAFYRKIKQPDKFLSIAEKQAIARVYNLKDAYLFPELEVNLQQGFGNEELV
jgi:hypothetical protein